MRPLSITIRNFLSYGDIPQKIDFQNYSFISLSGQNGNGKTAFLESIVWALWGIARKNQGVSKNDESLMRIGSELMFVSLEFFIDDKKYLVKRSCEKKGKRINTELSFFISSGGEDEWKNLSLSHQKETQDLINSMVSLDYETFVNTVFLRQGFSNEFSRKTPKERKDVLAKILGIDRIEKIREKILFEIKEKEPRINFLNHLKDSFNSEITIDELDNLKNELLQKKELYLKKKEELFKFSLEIKKTEEGKNLVFEEIEKLGKVEKKNYEEISILKNSFIKNFSDYKEVKKVIIEFKKKEKNLLLSVNLKNLNELEIFLNQKKNELEELTISNLEVTEEFLKKKIRTEKILSKVSKKKSDFERLKKETKNLIFEIENKKCFYCKEPLSEEKRNFFLKNENLKISYFNDKILKFLKFEEKLNILFNFLDKKIDENLLIKSKLKEGEDLYKSLQKEFNEVKKIKDFIKEKDFYCIKKILKEKILKIKNLKSLFDLFNKQKDEIEKRKIFFLENLNFLIKKKEPLEKELEIEHKFLSEEYGKYLSKKENFEKFSKKKLDIENEYAEIMSFYSVRSKLADILGKDAIQAALIEESIPELETEANKILSKLSDGKCTIYIESTKDLKSGKSKETLEIIIEDIFGVRPYEFFSGGESFRIDLSLRIALSKILARRAGSSIRTFIIDEGFGSQDGVALESIVQMLYSIQEIFDLIIVVSHLPFLKEEFPVHFIVNKGMDGSKITVID